MKALDPLGRSLPRGWTLVTIGEVCDQFGGEVQTGPFGSQLHAKDYVADGVPYVMPKDMIGGKVSERTVARVSNEDASRLVTHRLRSGDIVYARRGDIGRRALVTSREEGWLCGTGCLRIRLNCPSVTSEYFVAYLGHPIIRRWVEDRAQGATLLNLNTTILRGVPLRIPPLAEQRDIADILDKADSIRRKRKDAIALTEELLRSAFLEIFGDPVTNPKRWPTQTLSDIAQVHGGLQVTHARDIYPRRLPYLRVANVHRNRLDLREIKHIGVSEAEYTRCQLEKGDILVVEGHGNADELGRVAIWDGSAAPMTHQNHIIRVRVSDRGVLSSFLGAFLNSSEGRRQMLRFAKTTSGLNTLSTNNIRSLDVLVPSMRAQERFAGFVQSHIRLNEHLIQSLDMSEALFSSLLHRAFRGELTAPTSKSAAPTPKQLSLLE